MDQQTDQPTNEETNRQTNQTTDQWTNRRPNQWMDMPSNRDKRAAPKKQSPKKIPHCGHCSATALPQLQPLSKSATANVKQNRYRLRKYAPNVVPK